jgi:K+-sensing histidine kinase KdpD
MKNKRYIIPVAAIILAPIFIAIDLKTGLTAGMEPRPLGHYSKLAAKIGWLLVIAAAAYYALRTYLSVMSKKSFTHKGLFLLKHLLTILRKVHPYIGGAALALIAIHGFLFAYRIFNFEMNTATVTGILAFLAFFIAGILGITLHRNPANRAARNMHRYAAFITIALVIAHLLFPD